MFVDNLISPEVPVLSSHDKITKVLALMDEQQTRQLPLLSDGKYLGLIESVQLKKITEEKILSELDIPLLRPAIQTGLHFFEAIRIITSENVDLLPVLDKTNLYIGAVTEKTLLQKLIQFNSFNDEGNFLVLEMTERDYMLSEIAGIAEMNDIILLGVQTYTSAATGKFHVLLKTNRKDLESFITSLSQFNYEVIYRFDELEDTEGLKQNYEHLMNYINI